MCERDERGRFKPGASGNPAGRPAATPLLKLVEAAREAGATVTIQVRLVETGGFPR